MRIAVVTVSDRSSRGEREDRGGPAVREACLRYFPGAMVLPPFVVPDETDAIAAAITGLADDGACDLVLTTGGTGLAPRDVTPQATRRVLDYEIPGLAEAMRMETRARVATAILSRQVAGVRNSTLIVNLPGSPKGAVECLEAIAGALPHAVQTLRNSAGDVHPT